MAASPPQPGALTSVSERDGKGSMGTPIDYPDADIILRSCDSRDFRILKLYIIKRSPVLDKLIGAIPDLPVSNVFNGSETPLPIVHMPESGVILYSLLTFILPVPPVLPPSAEETMELLSVAQKYEMNHIMVHIRGIISLQDPPLIRNSNALQVYSLSHKYGLRQEVIQAARLTLKSTLTIENLEDKLDVIPSDHLHELWRYHQSVRRNLMANIDGFRGSNAFKELKSQKCVSPHFSFEIPDWIAAYISSMAQAPSSFNIFEFQSALAKHLTTNTKAFNCSSPEQCLYCASLPRQTMDELWTALTTFVYANAEQAESDFFFSERNLSSEDPIDFSKTTPSLPECLDVSDADIVIQSSDFANFRVRKSILSSSSQLFRDMFSLPQSSVKETIDGLLVVRLSEDAELVRALITLLYPIPPEIPTSYERILALLAAAQKYDMSAVQASIRAEVVRRKLPPSTGTQAFREFAIAFRNRLLPEMGTTAHLTLDYPLTFEALGDELPMFGGLALHELVKFRKACRDNTISCLESFFDIRSDLSNIWVGCPKKKVSLYPDVSHFGQTRRHRGGQKWAPELTSDDDDEPTLPSWLHDLFTRLIGEMRQCFTRAIMRPSSIRERYLGALRSHTPTSNSCPTCIMVHIREGEGYCAGLEKMLTYARNKKLDFV